MAETLRAIAKSMEHTSMNMFGQLVHTDGPCLKCRIFAVLDAELCDLVKLVATHNYQYSNPHGEYKVGYYWCLCGWEGPDRDSYWKHLAAELETYLAVERERIAAKAIDDERQNPWKQAIIEALIVDCILSKKHESDPQKAIADLIGWSIKLALDPTVSSDAAKLQAKARLEEAKLAPHEGNCLMRNHDGTPTGLSCSCRRGQRIAASAIESLWRVFQRCRVRFLTVQRRS